MFCVCTLCVFFCCRERARACSTIYLLRERVLASARSLHHQCSSHCGSSVHIVYIQQHSLFWCVPHIVLKKYNLFHFVNLLHTFDPWILLSFFISGGLYWPRQRMCPLVFVCVFARSQYFGNWIIIGAILISVLICLEFHLICRHSGAIVHSHAIAMWLLSIWSIDRNAIEQLIQQQQTGQSFSYTSEIDSKVKQHTQYTHKNWYVFDRA